MGHDHGRTCVCVADHRPRPAELNRHHIVPLYAGGPDVETNIAWVCPTTHVSTHELLREWERHDGEPPWAVRRSFNPFTRALAERGWRGIQALNSIQADPRRSP